MTYRHYSFAVLLSTITVWMTISSAHANQSNATNPFSLVLGIIPQQGAKKIKVLWEPLTQYIKKQTNYSVSVYGSADIPTYEDNLFIGKFDFAYVNPRLYLKANMHVGYLPVLKESNKLLSGIIVVAKDSPMESITDLMGKHFVSPQAAFAASALTRLNLQNLGVRVKNSFVETHLQGYALVANGSVDAAGGVQRTFDSLNPKLKENLKVLWVSKGVAPHAFIVHPRVNEKVKERIIDAILSFKETEEGKLFYKNLHLNPFMAANSSDWDDVRQLISH